jgi:hypothetical protein
MVRALTFCVAIGLAGLLPPVAAQAQTSSRSTSSLSNSNSRSGSSASSGRGITQAAQNVSSLATTDWQQAASRDTSTRGQFVGAEAADVPQMLDETQTNGRNARSSQYSRTQRRGTTSRRGSSQPGRSSQRNQASRYGQSANPEFRATLTLGFQYAPEVSDGLGRDVQACLARVPAFASGSAVRVSVKDNVVVLEGVVASKSDVAMALQMVALEPGVAKIDNRLTVAAGPTPPAALPN